MNETLKTFLVEHRFMIEAFVGMVFVSTYAYARFSNTNMERYMPANARYRFALMIYIALTVMVYFFLSLALTASVALYTLGTTFVKDFTKMFSEKGNILSAQLMVALLMTEALPRIKSFAYADRQLRIFFQRMASLSATAQSLSAKFQYEEFDLQPYHLEAIERAFRDHRFEEKDIQPEKSKKPQHIWTRVTLLWNGLARWEEQPNYQAFLANNKNEADLLREEHAALINKAKYCFKLSRAAERDPELHRALDDCTRHYTIQLKRHLQKLADFMSRGLLSAQKGEARIAAIAQLGFKAELNQGLSVDHLTLMFVMLFFILLVSFGIMHANSPSAAKTLILAIMVASIYSIGIVFALLARWHCEKVGKTKNAWATYFIMSLAAVGCGAAVSIFVNTAMQNWNLVAGLAAFTGEKWPWQLMVFTTTFCTAFLLNRPIPPTLRKEVMENRIQEGGMMGAALLASLIIAGGLMAFSLQEFVTRGVVALIIGASIGFFIPTWFRGAPRRNREQSENMVDYARLNSRRKLAGTR